MALLKQDWFTARNLHLAVSVVIIIPVALAYGALPNIVLPELFNFAVSATDLTNIFRAMMGLYMAMAAVWVTGIFTPRYWAAATIANVVFMGGLAVGRLISLAVDGMPSFYLSAGLLIEVVLVVWGLLNLRKYPHFHPPAKAGKGGGQE
jgi:hypothetical protein